MQLSTPSFFVFYLAVWLLYWAAAKVPTARLMVLVLANLFLLLKFGWLYLLLPVAASVDFLVGLGISGEQRTVIRRLLLAISLVVNLTLLAGPKILALRAGERGGSFSAFLTLSLSFYCFQSLTYTIDLYRRDPEAEATQSWLAYISSAVFFPVLVAGPILRLHGFLKQMVRDAFANQ